MKTAKEFLIEAINKMPGCLEEEEIQERFDAGLFDPELEAMENYRDQELEHVVTCNQALTLRIGGLVHEVSQLRAENQTLQEENNSFVSYINELEDALGLKNRSNPDLTIDDEPKSLFDKWKECKD